MMTRDSSCCPDPEVLAAFVAGSLTEDELQMTVEHLRSCERCQIIVAEVARTDREEREVRPPVPFPARTVRRSSRATPWWLAAAAAALIGVVYVAVEHRPSRTASGIQTLVAATPSDGRYIEPRLAGGFPWAPLRNVPRGGPEMVPGQMKLVGAAGEVLEKTANDPSAEGRHAAALAHLVAGRSAEASDLLVKAAKEKSDPAIWSDLAAARYTAALETDNPHLLAEALTAADAALRIRSAFPEALFNRALIVERLGLREQAGSAWRKYLAVDSTSPWAREAEKHLAGLAPSSTFKQRLERTYAQLMSDPAAARVLARAFPQEARIWGETEILARWADAWQRGDHAEAARHLAVAWAFGDELAASSGKLLSVAVRVINDADDDRRMTLARAHLQFRLAQRTYRGGRPAEAERLFEEAGRSFDSAGSPVGLLARCFAVNTQYDQGRIAEARARLEQLRASAPSSFTAYRAYIDWQIGLVRASQGSWGEAMESLRASIGSFERLHEMQYASTVREILAEIYDRIGDSRAAWHHRIVVLRELGRARTPKLLVTLDSAARGAALERNWPVTLSLLGLELEATDGSGDDLLYLETLLLRARVNGELARYDGARADLHRARTVLARMKDPAYRDRAESDLLTIEGLLTPAPGEALPLLSRAISFNCSRGRRMLLPDLHLHRGRALSALGKGDEAAAELQAGIDELESQRTTIAAGQERWGMFRAAEDLFDEAMSLALARGDVRGAFAYAERARSRELLESLPSSSRGTAVPAMARDAVLVEYASLGMRLVIFVVEGPRIFALQEEVARSALEEEIHLLERSAAAPDLAEFRRHAAILHARLVAPIANSLSQHRHLIFVPDATLRGLPFAALIDRSGKYLVEQHVISVAPSGAIVARLAEHPLSSAADASVLVVEGRAALPGSALDRLRAADREALAVAAAYRRAERLPKDADETTFVGRASAANVIHFIGHAIGGDGLWPALMMRNGNGDGRLDVRAIAAMRLRRTRVVVLAACSTAIGEERAGEGNISVARAFLAAGVPSVVATLWPIDDEPAADFFPRLHRYLASGVSPAEALRLAQLEAIRSRGAPPSLWAAVQVIGS